MKILTQYKNGNYKVVLFDNGTKIRLLDDGETEYKPEFPESIDLCISHKCSIGCKYCYADCTPEGDSLKIFQKSSNAHYFIERLYPGTELAVGGGALSEIESEEFLEFLNKCIWNDLIVNITVNIKEIMRKPVFLNRLRKYQMDKLIYGIGISYHNSKEARAALLECKRYLKNIVVHTIVGVTKKEDYEWLAENHFKVLILGYKTKGRGVIYKCLCDDKDTKEWTKKNILNLRNKFNGLSFDCLAVKQLDIKDQVDEDTWKNNYMGDDGKFTMFVDLVNFTFAKSSTETQENTYNFAYEHRDAESIFKYLQTKN